MNFNGCIELIIGPMYSGKSSELLRYIDKFSYLGKNIMVINHTLNNRYNSNGITTHNGKVHNDCIVVDKLEKIMSLYSNEFNNASIIIIDELQFFDDILEYIPDWCDKYNKYIVASGLNGDSNRKPFGKVLDLIPYCNCVHHLTGICSICCDGTPSIFSKKIVNNNNTILVGSNGMYIAVCRKHFYN